MSWLEEHARKACVQRDWHYERNAGVRSGECPQCTAIIAFGRRAMVQGLRDLGKIFIEPSIRRIVRRRANEIEKE